jgi:peptidoglycan hydrolase-like protein with peptidoglycan-binding domain
MKTKTKIIIGIVILTGLFVGAIIYIKKKKINDAFSALDKNVETGNVKVPSTSTSSTVLKKGSKGDAVKTLQTKLSKLGYKVGVIDGIFGSGTEAAVKAFQKDKNLTVDGIAGSATISALK